MMADRIPTFVVTGGPCGGKSTALAFLRQRLRDYGVTAIVVPELATQLFTNGIEAAAVMGTESLARRFQAEMLRAQMALEDRWRAFAEIQPAEQKVLICDRGAMDPAAYIDRDVFEGILYDLGLSLADVRDRRYEAVLHLVSAARGAESFYNLGNAARRESVEEARALDERTLAAWLGHPHLTIIGNADSTPVGDEPVSFDVKMNRVLEAVCRSLGLPVPAHVQRKFLVRVPDSLPIATASCEIEQVYLVSQEPGVERRIRHSTPDSAFAVPGGLYVYTEKREGSRGLRLSAERVLSAQEYLALRSLRDPARHVIRKTRRTFAWADQYFRLDVVSSPRPLTLLEVEVTEARPDVLLPPFIDVLSEVTDQPEYRMATFASNV